MRRVIVLVVAVLLALPIVYAQSYPPCSQNSDCSQGYYCIGNQCREPCTSNADCDKGTCQQDGYCGTVFCGDGSVGGGEQCDVGDTVACDGCSPSCQNEVCGNEVIECGEQCDDGGTCLNPAGDPTACTNNVPCDLSSPCTPQDGDGCSANCEPEVPSPSPSASPSSSPSASPAAKEVNYVLFDLALGHNMLFSKVMDLLHIIKEALFQLEIKMVEIQLTNNPCNQQPVSFWIPADLNPYGKLNEIDALIELLIKSIQDGQALGGDFGDPDLEGAQARLTDADICIGLDRFREAFECKCLAYRENLLGLVDGSGVLCNPCI